MAEITIDPTVIGINQLEKVSIEKTDIYQKNLIQNTKKVTAFEVNGILITNRLILTIYFKHIG